MRSCFFSVFLSFLFFFRDTISDHPLSRLDPPSRTINIHNLHEKEKKRMLRSHTSGIIGRGVSRSSVAVTSFRRICGSKPQPFTHCCVPQHFTQIRGDATEALPLPNGISYPFV